MSVEIVKQGNLAPSVRNLEIAKQYFPNGGPDDSVELHISIPSENINVRELSAFIYLLYRADGAISQRGMRAYSHNREMQIQFTQLKFGSSEFNISELLSSANAERLFVIWIFLKHIPTVINSFLSAIEKVFEISSKYEELQERREKRRVRKAIRELVSDDLVEIQVDRQTKEKLVKILSEIYSQNIKDLPAASRFIRYYVQKLELRLKPKE